MSDSAKGAACIAAIANVPPRPSRRHGVHLRAARCGLRAARLLAQMNCPDQWAAPAPPPVSPTDPVRSLDLARAREWRQSPVWVTSLSRAVRGSSGLHASERLWVTLA